MATTQGNSVLHRKTRVARKDFDARAMSPSKALRLALCKAGDRLFGLPVAVSTVEQHALGQADIQAEIRDDGLLVLLDGAQGRRGAAFLDHAFLAALIEVQTMGHVRNGAAPARRVTRTDAAIVAPLIDDMMQLFDAQMQDGVAAFEPPGFRFGDMIEDTRTLALAMDKPGYDRFRLLADLGGGARTGTLDIVLPKELRQADGGTPGEAADGATLASSALSAPVVLSAVMARISMPLDQICALEPGQRLTIPREAISDSKLLGTGNHQIASVKLGQINGWRAVRLLDAGGAGAGLAVTPPSGTSLQEAGAPPEAASDTARPARAEGEGIDAAPVPDEQAAPVTQAASAPHP